MIACANEDDVASLYLACLATGVTAVIVDSASSPAEANLLIAMAEPKVMFLDEGFLADAGAIADNDGSRVIPVKPAKPSRTSFGLLRRRKPDEARAPETYPGLLETLPSAPEPLSEFADDTTAVILFTSGTTSRPKDVELTHRNLFEQFRTFERHSSRRSSNFVAKMPTSSGLSDMRSTSPSARPISAKRPGSIRSRFTPTLAGFPTRSKRSPIPGPIPTAGCSISANVIQIIA